MGHGDSEMEAPVDCPVIAAWMKLDGLASRAAGGKIADISSLPLTRESVADNAEILEPLVREFGFLASTIVIVHLSNFNPTSSHLRG